MATIGTFQALSMIFTSAANSAVSLSHIVQASAELSLHTLSVADRLLEMADRALDDSLLTDLQSVIDESQDRLAIEIKKDEVDASSIKTLESTIKLLQKEHSKAAVAYAKSLTAKHIDFKSRFAED